MAFAVDLDEIGLYFSQESVHHGFREGSSGIGDIFRGVQIEMHTEKAICTSQFFRILRN
jgi:hypothetical protein